MAGSGARRRTAEHGGARSGGSTPRRGALASQASSGFAGHDHLRLRVPGESVSLEVTTDGLDLQPREREQASQLLGPDLSVGELDRLHGRDARLDSRAASHCSMVVDANVRDLGGVIVVVVGGVHHRLTRCRVLESSLAMVLVRVEL